MTGLVASIPLTPFPLTWCLPRSVAERTIELGAWFGDSRMDGCWNVWELGCRIDWEAWAAIFTALAVAIALGLGVWPILLQKARDRARSRALGMYAAANLDVQYLWVRVAHDVGGMRPLTPAVYNKAIGFALNASDAIFSEAVREIASDQGNV